MFAEMDHKNALAAILLVFSVIFKHLHQLWSALPLINQAVFEMFTLWLQENLLGLSRQKNPTLKCKALCYCGGGGEG